ncbi:MAG: Ig-like domain-containing protein, partial [Proteobacteria bacterium]|nr:Ig-like domain-containing protein [Pseudomonadota bacterium]
TNAPGAGAAYVVFGAASGFGTELSLGSLDGTNGFRLNGEAANDFSGNAVSDAGDVNGDGFNDIIVGGYRTEPNGSDSGSAYTVFGSNYQASEDDSARLIGNVLANDSDPDGDTLSISTFDGISSLGATITAGAVEGTFVYDATGSATLQALFDGQSATDTFTYTVSDGNGGFDTATVSVTVQGVTDLPIAVDDAFIIDEDETIVIDVLANDTDFVGAGLSTQSTNPANGVLVFDAIAKTYSYTPNQDFYGTDSFDYTVEDGQGGMDTATVTFTINPINDAPVFGGDHQVSLMQGGLVVLTALDLTAFDPDDAATDVTFVLNNSPVGGNLTNGGVALSDGQSFTLADIVNGDIAYDHGGSSAADDSFVVELFDDDPASGGTATIDILVASPPAPPSAVPDLYIVSNGANVFMDLTANDTDPNDDPLSPIASTNPANGFLGFNPIDETYFYIPDAGVTGSDSFTYTITDGNSGFDTGTVLISVLADGDALVGTTSNEIFQGSSLDDDMTGGGGDDLFQFKDGDGDDSITDFAAGTGSDDRIDVSAFGFSDLADLLAATNDAGADTVISLDADDSVTLIGVQKADLHEDDFLF